MQLTKTGYPPYWRCETCQAWGICEGNYAEEQHKCWRPSKAGRAEMEAGQQNPATLQEFADYWTAHELANGPGYTASAALIQAYAHYGEERER